jgi:hypothetical protein
MKLHIEDLRVTSFVPADNEVNEHAANTDLDWTCRNGACVSWDGQVCITKEFGGGDTCESGPYYYC